MELLKKIKIILIILIISCSSCKNSQDKQANSKLNSITNIKHDAEYYNLLGLSLIDSSKNYLNIKNKKESILDKAIYYFNKSIEIDSTYKYAYSNKSDVFKTLGKLDEATNTLQKIIVIDDKYALAYFKLGILQNLNGNSESAMKNYEVALENYQNIPTHKLTILDDDCILILKILINGKAKVIEELSLLNSDESEFQIKMVNEFDFQNLINN